MKSYTDTDSNKSTEKFEKIKSNIEEWYKFFQSNIERYKYCMRFAFLETIDEETRQKLRALGKPDIEVNYILPYLTRMMGERSKQIPDVAVRGDGSGSPVNVAMVDLVEGYLRDATVTYAKSGEADDVTKEQLGGGFSALKITTNYKNSRSWEQEIKIEKSKDPTMCFFDPMAKKPSKEDGMYCGEVYPMTKEKFKEEFPEHADKVDNLRYRRGGSFSWSYKNQSKSIILVADYYCVKYRKFTIVKLSDGSSKTKSEYNKMKENWSSIEPMPEKMSERKEKEAYIKRIVLYEGGILSEEKTEYPYLPYVFVNGNGAFMYRDQKSDEMEQSTIPYIYNAIGTQKLLNATAQTYGEFLENQMSSKYMMDQRALPDGASADDWTMPQKASVLLYKGVDDDGVPVEKPSPLIQTDLASSIMQVFSNMQNTMQNTMGSYDAALGISKQSLSGIAIEDGATQNNAIAMPYMAAYMHAFNRCAKIMLEMLPKYHVTPMTIPYMDREGERHFVKINQMLPDGSPDPASLRFDYDKDDLGVEVSAGYSFSIQKDKSLKMLVNLAQAFPGLAEVINQKGQDVIIDNIDIRGADKLKEIVKEFQQEKAAQPKPNPMQQEQILKQQQMAMQQQKMQQEAQMKMKEIQMRQQELDQEKLMAMLQFYRAMENDAVQREKVAAEIASKNMETKTRLAGHLLERDDKLHKHTMDIVNMKGNNQ